MAWHFRSKRAAKFDDLLPPFLHERGGFARASATRTCSSMHPDLGSSWAAKRHGCKACSNVSRPRALAETTEAVLRLGARLAEKFGQRKSAQAALDYEDLIIRTERLLHRPGIAPWVLYKLDGGLDHILVDEAQDTSRAQWNIVKALADEFFARHWCA